MPENTLHKVGRLNMARLQAEEVVLADLVWLTPPEDEESMESENPSRGVSVRQGDLGSAERGSGHLLGPRSDRTPQAVAGDLSGPDAHHLVTRRVRHHGRRASAAVAASMACARSARSRS